MSEQPQRSALDRSEKSRAASPAVLVLLIGMSLSIPARAQSSSTAPAPGVPWPATDGLGRRLPVADDAQVQPLRTDRFVGIFYFLWHDNPGFKRHDGNGPYDVSKILTRDPGALDRPSSPLWGPPGVPHYWGEPLFGYYLSADPWVLRRHAQLLSAAGIDTLIFDVTNGPTYPDVYNKLCEVFTQIRGSGGRTPHIAFMVNTQAGETARRIYLDLYKPGRFRDLWFFWQGKPLLICDPNEADAELRSFFTLRRAHWPFTQVNTPYAWHWEAAHPQVYGYTTDPKRPEEVNVSVAQNLRARDGQVTNMSAGNARGRGFANGKADHAATAVDRGANFAEQWQRAISLDPPFVMVTGWNEWIAGRFGEPGKRVEFVDQFNQEYSRDIEPMKGGHADHYYYQLVAGVRRFKGIAPLPSPSPSKVITIDGEFDQWNDVTPAFADDIGETIARDHNGAGGLHYSNRTGRNDLVSFKVTRDSQNVFFYAHTREPISPRTGPAWMWLLIDWDQNPQTGWHGYEYIVNRSIETDRTTWLERHDGAWNWKPVSLIQYRTAGNDLHLAIPLKALGAGTPSQAIRIDFKWADHLDPSDDRMGYYSNGDVAPEGRFRYRATLPASVRPGG
jgi:hypothetical protein